MQIRIFFIHILTKNMERFYHNPDGFLMSLVFSLRFLVNFHENVVVRNWECYKYTICGTFHISPDFFKEINDHMCSKSEILVLSLTERYKV